jgi:hypothetical protein
MSPIISQQVVERIKNDHISPKPRWRFQAERFAAFSFLAFFLIIGALALSLIMELVEEMDLNNVLTRPRGISLSIYSFPYFWLIVLMIFAALAVADFFRTRNGYRYKIRNVALIFIGSTVILGTLFYTLGISENLHLFLGQNVASYSNVVKDPYSLWSQPDDGLLSGVILSTDDKCRCMQVVDWGRNIWDVDYSQALIRSDVLMNDGEGIRILGQKKDKNKFEAEKIDPWTRGFMKIIKGVDKEEDRITKDIKQDVVGK